MDSNRLQHWNANPLSSRELVNEAIEVALKPPSETGLRLRVMSNRPKYIFLGQNLYFDLPKLRIFVTLRSRIYRSDDARIRFLRPKNTLLEEVHASQTSRCGEMCIFCVFSGLARKPKYEM